MKTIFIIFLLVASAYSQAKDAVILVANVPIKPVIKARQEDLGHESNLSIRFEISSDALKKGVIAVRAVNLVVTGVEQSALSGQKTKTKINLGPLGMSIPASARNVQLKYDQKSQTIIGEVPVQAHFAQLDELFPPKTSKESKEPDIFVSRTQRGFIKLEINLAEPLDKAIAEAVRSGKVARVTGKASTLANIQPISGGNFIIPGYRLEAIAPRFVADIADMFRFEGASLLCIQPVRIRSSATDPAPTGLGLEFGLPGAIVQWNKADVQFRIRPWMAMTNPAWRIATPDTENYAIRNSVNVDDCVEVFFVDNFDPVSWLGGGATWGGGTANARTVSADGNAVGGIDLTHLAHEWGHALGLGHPGETWEGLSEPSSNTLMCISGWRNDNPRRNSLENATHVSNPLLTYIIKDRTRGPDCTASADCGRCP